MTNETSAESVSVLRPVLGLLAWGALMWGALNLRRLDDVWLGGSGHSLCGPWGCGPPLNAVLALHVFWFVVFLPPLLFAGFRLRPSIGRCIGLCLMLGGLLLLVGIGVRDYFAWYSRVGSYQRQFAVQRFLFVVATQVDIPVMQMFLGGMMVAGCSALRSRCRFVKEPAAEAGKESRREERA